MRKFGVLWEWTWREPKHFLERALYEFSTTTYYYAILDSTKEISRNETARRRAYFLFKFKGTFRISLNVLNSCQCEQILFCSCIAFKRISAILRNSISTFFSHMKSKSSWDACRWVKWVEGIITLAKITLESKTQNWFFISIFTVMISICCQNHCYCYWFARMKTHEFYFVLWWQLKISFFEELS